MAEPAITEAEELRRQGRRGLVPCHAPIDARIVSPALLSVTVDPQSFVPIAPRTARLGRLDPAPVVRSQRAGPVQTVVLTGVAGRDGFEVSDSEIGRASGWERVCRYM